MYQPLPQRLATCPVKARPGKPLRHWLSVTLLLLASACSISEPPASEEQATEENSEVSAPIQTVQSMSDEKLSSTQSPDKTKPAHLVPPQIVERLIDAVAAEAGVPASEVKLERAEKATFGDSSLNCPEPNMAYAQVIVHGYWVVFHVGREEFDMRVTQQGKFTRCTGSTKRPPIRYDDT